MVGLRRARESIEQAAGKVATSAETAAQAIGVVAVIAVVALLIGLAALVIAVRGRRAVALAG